jgi:predicted secreted protein
MKGDYRILTISYNSGPFYPIACVTDNGMSESVQMLDTTTRDNGGWRTSVPTMQSGTIDFTGIYEQGGDFTIDDLRDIFRGGNIINWKISSSDGGYIHDGEGYFSALSDASEMDSFVSFSGSIQISGNIGLTAFYDGDVFYADGFYDSGFYEGAS